MRISDWSSDVCSSDISIRRRHGYPSINMPDDEETQHEWASGTSTPYPRRGSREQLPELGSRAIKAGFNRLLADPQNHRSVGLAHFVDVAKEQYLAQTLRQLVDRPTNPGEFSPKIGRPSCRERVCQYV